VVFNVFRTSTTVVLNRFAEGSQIQTYEFLESLMAVSPAPVLNFQLNSESAPALDFEFDLGGGRGENDVSRVKRGRWNRNV